MTSRNPPPKWWPPSPGEQWPPLSAEAYKPWWPNQQRLVDWLLEQYRACSVDVPPVVRKAMSDWDWKVAGAYAFQHLDPGTVAELERRLTELGVALRISARMG